MVIGFVFYRMREGEKLQGFVRGAHPMQEMPNLPSCAAEKARNSGPTGLKPPRAVRAVIGTSARTLSMDLFGRIAFSVEQKLICLAS